MSDWNFERNALGRLVLIAEDGERHENVVPVRAFPIAAPEEGVSLLSQDGRELVWIDRLGQLDEARAAEIRSELAAREFVPEIRALKSVSTFATPSTWFVETDRGATHFILRGEEDIRRLAANMLLIADSHGIEYLIRDLPSLDRNSRKLLDRFL